MHTITNPIYVVNPKTNENEGISCVFDGKTICVPLDPANRHYAAILEWVAEGNTIQEAD